MTHMLVSSHESNSREEMPDHIRTFRVFCTGAILSTAALVLFDGQIGQGITFAVSLVSGTLTVYLAKLLDITD